MLFIDPFLSSITHYSLLITSVEGHVGIRAIEIASERGAPA